MSITNKAKLRIQSRYPVRAAVMENWVEIQEAMADGIPLETIYWVLKKDGKSVGAGPSSFRGAVNYLLQNLPINSSVTKTEEHVGVVINTTNREQFADNRNKSDWG